MAYTTGNSYQYIKRYAEKIKKTARAAYLKVLGHPERAINLILKDEPQLLAVHRDIHQNLENSLRSALQLFRVMKPTDRDFFIKISFKK